MRHASRKAGSNVCWEVAGYRVKFGIGCYTFSWSICSHVQVPYALYIAKMCLPDMLIHDEYMAWWEKGIAGAGFLRQLPRKGELQAKPVPWSGEAEGSSCSSGLACFAKQQGQVQVIMLGLFLDSKLIDINCHAWYTSQYVYFQIKFFGNPHYRYLES